MDIQQPLADTAVASTDAASLRPSTFHTLLPTMPRELTIEYESQLAALSATIRSQCGSFLDDLRQSFWWPWRGLEKDLGGAFLGETPQHRSPRDSHADLQLIFDHALTAVGCTALRRNSIFVTGDPNHALAYGSLYVIIPSNSCDFTWSRGCTYHDLILRTLHDIPGASIKPSARAAARAELDNLTAGRLSVPDGHQTTLTNLLTMVLGGGLPSNQLWTEEVKRLSTDFQQAYPHSWSLVELNTRKFQKKYLPSRTHFPVALQHRGEILIRGTYYGLSKDVFNAMRDRSLL